MERQFVIKKIAFRFLYLRELIPIFHINTLAVKEKILNKTFIQKVIQGIRNALNKIWNWLVDKLDFPYDVIAPIFAPLLISILPFIIYFKDNGQVSEIIQILFAKDGISWFSKGIYLMVFGLFLYYLTFSIVTHGIRSAAKNKVMEEFNYVYISKYWILSFVLILVFLISAVVREQIDFIKFVSSVIGLAFCLRIFIPFFQNSLIKDNSKGNEIELNLSESTHMSQLKIKYSYILMLLSGFSFLVGVSFLLSKTNTNFGYFHQLAILIAAIFFYRKVSSTFLQDENKNEDKKVALKVDKNINSILGYYGFFLTYLFWGIVLYTLLYFLIPDNWTQPIYVIAFIVFFVLLILSRETKDPDKKVWSETILGQLLFILILVGIFTDFRSISFLVLGLVFAIILIFNIQNLSYKKKTSGLFILIILILISMGIRSLGNCLNLWQAGNTIHSLNLENGIEYQSVDKNYQDWHSTKRKEKAINDSSSVYILVTEGGGIRSAIWTTAVFAKLDSIFPNFLDKTYAISGVSGGSVGSIVYAAMKYDSLDSLQQLTQQVYSQDLLSNTILSTMVGVPIQTFFPGPLKKLDRAYILENDIMQAYDTCTTFGTLGKGIVNLYQENDYSIPNLFLNTTHVENGKKCIVSNLKMNSKYFPNDEDLIQIIQKDVPLKTAAVLSARFPIVSSSGKVHTPTREAWGNLVDGGFYDNSGLLTAIDIVNMIHQETPDSLNFKPVIIFLQNGNDQNSKKGSKGFAPLSSIMNTWAENTERRNNDIEALQEELNFDFIQFRLNHSRASNDYGFPLGWLLSERTILEIMNEVDLLDKNVPLFPVIENRRDSLWIAQQNFRNWLKLDSLERRSEN